jgi:hypothetical protein
VGTIQLKRQIYFISQVHLLQWLPYCLLFSLLNPREKYLAFYMMSLFYNSQVQRPGSLDPYMYGNSFLDGIFLWTPLREKATGDIREATRPKLLTRRDRMPESERDETGRDIPRGALLGPMGIITQVYK